MFCADGCIGQLRLSDREVGSNSLHLVVEGGFIDSAFNDRINHLLFSPF